MPKKISKAKKAQESLAAYEPLAVSLASDDYPLTTRRRNVSAITEREFRYKNIEDGLTPFRYDKHNYGNGIETCSIYEAVILCQKAYYNYGPLRNVIDLMVDFSATDLYLKGSTAKIRKFYQAWFNKIGINNLVTQFFREYYRSGNVFLYKHNAKLKESDLRNLVKIYSGTSVASAVLPVRYVILNPADIQSTGTMSMGIAKTYYKRLSDYELERLRNPRTPEDKEVFDSLDEDVKKQIKSGVAQALIPLPMKDITYIGYCRLSYEPFAVPFAYPVLEDINYKLELKKIDMALSRSVQQSMLLVTMGTEQDGVNQNNILAIQKILESQTIARSIVADFSTKAEFVSPDISELLSPEKYTVVDRDINLSLNNILVGEEKFANSKNKIDVFIARLEQGRKVFLEEFLKIEMAKIAEEMGFDGPVPTPYFDAITLTDDINKMRVYTQMLQLGVLTPDQAMKAIDTGRLPNKEEMEEAQKEYIQQRETDNFYQPLIGGGQKQSENGRPPGTQKIPQTTKKIGQIGTGEKFDIEKIAKNIVIAGKLDNVIKKKLKSKFKLKELTPEQEALVPELKSLVIANHEPSEWLDKADTYCDRPLDTNPERVNRVQDIALNHQVETWMAGILLASIKHES